MSDKIAIFYAPLVLTGHSYVYDGYAWCVGGNQDNFVVLYMSS